MVKDYFPRCSSWELSDYCANTATFSPRSLKRAKTPQGCEVTFFILYAITSWQRSLTRFFETDRRKERKEQQEDSLIPESKLIDKTYTNVFYFIKFMPTFMYIPCVKHFVNWRFLILELFKRWLRRRKWEFYEKRKCGLYNENVSGCSCFRYD